MTIYLSLGFAILYWSVDDSPARKMESWARCSTCLKNDGSFTKKTRLLQKKTKGTKKYLFSSKMHWKQQSSSMWTFYVRGMCTPTREVVSSTRKNFSTLSNGKVFGVIRHIRMIRHILMIRHHLIIRHTRMIRDRSLETSKLDQKGIGSNCLSPDCWWSDDWWWSGDWWVKFL